MYCARHPKVETNLRCGKCGQLICPKCAVQTPVGVRCPDCAKLTRLPVFQVSALDHLKAVGTGLGLAITLGVVWGIIAPHLLFFSYLVALVVGYVIGELVSRSVNRKRGVGLQVIAGISVVICYLIAIAFGYYLSLFGLLALAAGIFIAVSRLR